MASSNTASVLFALAWWITDLQMFHLDVILVSSVILATEVQRSQQNTWFLPPPTGINVYFKSWKCIGKFMLVFA